MISSGEPIAAVPDPRPTVRQLARIMSKGCGCVITQESGSDKHVDVDRETLDDTSDRDDSGTDKDCPFSPAIVGQIWSDYQTDDTTNTLNCIE